MAVIAHHHLVVRLRARAHRFKEPIADLNAFDGLHAHGRGSQGGVEPAVGFHIGADACRHAIGNHLDDTTKGVRIGFRLIDARDHPRFGITVERAHGRGVQSLHVVGGRVHRLSLDTCTTDGEYVGDGADARHLLEEPCGHLTQGNARSRLACA